LRNIGEPVNARKAKKENPAQKNTRKREKIYSKLRERKENKMEIY